MNTIQNRIIQLCQAQVEDRNLAATFSEILHISKDAAYRRIRGETLFNINELAALCEHFTLSLDHLLQGNQDQIAFRFQSLYDGRTSVMDYFESTRNFLFKMKHSEDCHLTTIAMDIPVFRRFQYPLLRKFSYFYWQKTVLRRAEMKGMKLDEYQLTEEEHLFFEEIATLQARIPSTEIWSLETLTSTLKRIEYYTLSNKMGRRAEVKNLLNELKHLLQNMVEETEKGGRQFGSTFIPLDFYVSEVYLSNNLFQVQMQGEFHTFFTFNSLNSLYTSSLVLSEECQHWVQYIRSHSINISKASERIRYKFFADLEEKIDVAMKEWAM